MAPKARQERSRRFIAVCIIAAAVVLAAGVGFYFITRPSQQTTGTKPVILYVNQGNGIVNGSNFGAITSYATSNSFNTIFFQMYRQGLLLFSPTQLIAFVNESHSSSLKIFFALYITNASQAIPASIYDVGEDGINLDMSTLPLPAQQTQLTNLQAFYHGEVAVTTTDMYSQLTPNLLILETYGTSYQQYIRHGTVASVGVFATSSAQDYKSQFQYALQNSDGVMVFDYAGLIKRGY